MSYKIDEQVYIRLHKLANTEQRCINKVHEHTLFAKETKVSMHNIIISMKGIVR